MILKIKNDEKELALTILENFPSADNIFAGFRKLNNEFVMVADYPLNTPYGELSKNHYVCIPVSTIMNYLKDQFGQNQTPVELVEKLLFQIEKEYPKNWSRLMGLDGAYAYLENKISNSEKYRNDIIYAPYIKLKEVDLGYRNYKKLSEGQRVTKNHPLTPIKNQRLERLVKLRLKKYMRFNAGKAKYNGNVMHDRNRTHYTEGGGMMRRMPSFKLDGNGKFVDFGALA